MGLKSCCCVAVTLNSDTAQVSDSIVSETVIYRLPAHFLNSTVIMLSMVTTDARGTLLVFFTRLLVVILEKPMSDCIFSSPKVWAAILDPERLLLTQSRTPVVWRVPR